MTSTNDIGLTSERVRFPTVSDLSDVHCSTICENILWKPVSCQECETHFCSTCITKWLSKNPNQCPLRCDTFVQRPCSKFISRQLANLKIACIYQPYGCEEVVPYDALERHEMMCDYKLVQCSTCQLKMPQKNWTEHQVQCQSNGATCGTGHYAYRPNDSFSQQPDIFSLREEFQQYQLAAQSEIAGLRAEVIQFQQDQVNSLVSRGFVLDENALRRIPLKSTIETETLNRNRIVSDQASSKGTDDGLLCSTCREVLWKPVFCGKCRCLFCGKCRPQIGIFNRISTFFGGERPRHGPKNCDTFEEAPVPNHIIAALRQLKMRCAYAQNGCRMFLSYYELEDHEQKCEFEKIPCELCQKPLSPRVSNGRHPTRACFDEMRRKNPAGIQQQFKVLLDATEKAEAENNRLKSIIENLQTQIRNLDQVYMKKPEKPVEKK